MGKYPIVSGYFKLFKYANKNVLHLHRSRRINIPFLLLLLSSSIIMLAYVLLPYRYNAYLSIKRILKVQPIYVIVYNRFLDKIERAVKLTSSLILILQQECFY